MERAKSRTPTGTGSTEGLPVPKHSPQLCRATLALPCRIHACCRQRFGIFRLAAGHGTAARTQRYLSNGTAAQSLSLAPRAGWRLYITRRSPRTPPVVNLEHIVHAAVSPFYLGNNRTRNPVNFPSPISSSVLSHSSLSQGCRLVPVIHLQGCGQGRQSNSPEALPTQPVQCSAPNQSGEASRLTFYLHFSSRGYDIKIQEIFNWRSLCQTQTEGTTRQAELLHSDKAHSSNMPCISSSAKPLFPAASKRTLCFGR